ncbi:MAG TPA: hypothetical protein VJI32_00480 [Candidatus Nanoarchaeia archaeon]|nr:hypothetical protein [Candidatus Nanoarchaeia archaeon]
MFTKIRGWFQKNGVTTNSSSIHINEIADWVDQKKKEAMVAHKLEEETTNHINSLKDKRWVLDNKLDEWQQRAKQARNTDIGLLLVDVRKMADLLRFPNDKNTLSSILDIHEKVDAAMEAVTQKIEKSSFKDNFAFILPDGSTVSINPVLQELQEIHSLLGQFEQTVALSGFHKIKTLTEKSITIDGYSDRLYQSQQQLKVFQEKHTLVQSKQQEKEAELQQLQQDTAYASFLGIKDQRSKLMAEIENNPDFHQRFEMKQRLDALAKAVGNKELLLKLEDIEYRMTHFRTQSQRLQEEIVRVQEEMNEVSQLRQRETEFFTNLVKVSLGQDIEIKA